MPHPKCRSPEFGTILAEKNEDTFITSKKGQFTHPRISESRSLDKAEFRKGHKKKPKLSRIEIFMARKTAKNYSSESEPESEDNSLSSSKIRKCSFANQNGTKENTFPLIVKLEESTPNGIKTDVDNQITERHTEPLCSTSSSNKFAKAIVCGNDGNQSVLGNSKSRPFKRYLLETPAIMVAVENSNLSKAEKSNASSEQKKMLWHHDDKEQINNEYDIFEEQFSINTDKEAVKPVSNYFASSRTYRWVSLGKRECETNAKSAQLADVLRLPNRVLSFLKVDGQSVNGYYSTNKNVITFVVLEGDVTIQINKMQFEAEKGDSFYVPQNSCYRISNKSTEPAMLSVFQLYRNNFAFKPEG